MADELVDLERDPQGEPVFALPGRAIALGLIVGAAACGVVGVVATELIPAAIGMQVLPGTWVAAILGVGAASIGNALGLLVLWPSARRPASTWTSFWMAASGLRLMATGGLAALLYFRSLGEPKAFVLATGLTYVALLVSETVAVAKVLGPVLAQPGSGRSKGPEPTDPT